jgi:hypothetical protein
MKCCPKKVKVKNFGWPKSSGGGVDGWIFGCKTCCMDCSQHSKILLNFDSWTVARRNLLPYRFSPILVWIWPLILKAGLHIRQHCWQYCSRLFCLLSTIFLFYLNVLVFSNIASFIAHLKACANRALNQFLRIWSHNHFQSC